MLRITSLFSQPSLQISSRASTIKNSSVATKILHAFFKKYFILITTPRYRQDGNTIIISLCYYAPHTLPTAGAKDRSRPQYKNRQVKVSRVNKVFTSLMSNSRAINIPRIKFLARILTYVFQANIKLELTRLRYVYHDSAILAQFLGLNSMRATYALFKKVLRSRISIKDSSILLSDKSNKESSILRPLTYITGFKIRIAGRLHRQRVVPKKTVKSTYKGSISPTKTKILDDYTVQGKNKKGAFSIRVWLSHKNTK